MLGPLLPSTDMARAASTSLQARIWWFSTKQGVLITPDSYSAHLASHPDTSTPEPAILARIEDVQRRMGMKGESNVPSWQVHAPKADLRVKASDGVERGEGGEGDAPYPEQFRAVIEAVTQGKAVPGIKEIPNTLVRLPVCISPCPRQHEVCCFSCVEDMTEILGCEGHITGRQDAGSEETLGEGYEWSGGRPRRWGGEVCTSGLSGSGLSAGRG